MNAEVARARARSVESYAELDPDRLAVCESTRSLTWAQWNAQADRLAQALHVHGDIGAGDLIAVCMHNRLEWFVTQAAAAKLDACLVPISHRLTPAEIHYIVADSGARAFVFDAEDLTALSRVWTNRPAGEKRARVSAAVSVWPLDGHSQGALSFAELALSGVRVHRFAAHAPRSIVYTSGTTGRPRGVVSGAIERGPRQTSAALGSAAEAVTLTSERNLLGVPLNHAAGQASARGTLSRGGRVYLMPRFHAEDALRIIDRERITHTFLVPTMLNRIVNLPSEARARYDVSSIRVITTGASPCPQSVKERVIGYFGAHCLYEGYGSTEVGLVTRMLPQDHLAKPGSCGKVFDHVEVRVTDAGGAPLPRGHAGEIWVRAPEMIERYLNESTPATLRDGFFPTGDIGRFDDDDYLYVIDRKTDLIISGGVNIYPAEVEDALRRHPAVLDAAVFGIPNADWGEEVKAIVECVDGRSVTEADLLAFISSELAGYKRPRSIEFVNEIPRNATGKTLKVQLRAPYWADAGKSI